MPRLKRTNGIVTLALITAALGAVCCISLFIWGGNLSTAIASNWKAHTSGTSKNRVDEPFVVPKDTPRRPAEAPADSYVSGKVKDTLGSPVSGASVSLCLDGGRLLRGIDVLALSDDKGEFRLRVPVSGAQYAIHSKKDGYLCTRVERQGTDFSSRFTAGKEGVAGVECVMTTSAQIEGRVVDQFGKPIPNVSVCTSVSDPTMPDMPDSASVRDRPTPDMAARASVLDHDPAAVVDQRTDKNGRFCVRGLLSGTYNLWCRLYMSDVVFQECGSAGSPLLTAEIHEGERKASIELVINLDPSRTVSGRVFDEIGQAIAGAQVWATVDSRNLVVGGARSISSATGEFKVENIAPTSKETYGEEDIRRVVINVTCKGYEPRALAGVPVGAKDLQITLLGKAYGKVRVELVDKTTNGAIEHGKVYYLGSYSRFNEVYRYASLPVELKRDGAFFVSEDIPEGTAVLQTIADGYASVYKDDVVVEANKTNNVKVAMSSQGYICLDIMEPTQTKDSWYIGGLSAAFVPVDFLVGRQMPFEGIPQNMKRPSACDNPNVEGHKRDGAVIEAGECIVSLNGLAVIKSQSMDGGAVGTPEKVLWFWNKRVQVASGAISDIVFDCDELMHHPQVAVDLSNMNVVAGSMLILISGEYNGFLEQSRGEAREGRYLLDYYTEVDPSSGKCVIPFVPPGYYTLLFFEHYGDLECSTPHSKRLSVNGGGNMSVSF